MRYYSCCFHYLFFIVSCISSVQPVRIKELRVPSIARHGASVILDCDYALDEDSNNSSINDKADNIGLVVKWYLNDQSRPVYVWIPGSSGPRGLGVLSGRLNLTYRASDDARTEYRALHIPSSTVDLAGDYTCVVSTFHGEDRRTKNMLVFAVPGKNFRLQKRVTNNGHTDIVCSAEGVFPEPEMIIRVHYENVTNELTGGAFLHRQRDGLFDVSLHVPLLVNDVTNHSPVQVTCELSIPDANYTAHKEMLYFSGIASENNKYTWIVLTAYSIVKYLLNSY